MKIHKEVKSTVTGDKAFQTFTTLLVKKMNMPPIVQFDPHPVVLYWLSDTERRHKSTEKASTQDWFRHTFGFDAAQDAYIGLTETKVKRLLRKMLSFADLANGHFCSISKLCSSLNLAILLLVLAPI